MCGYHLPQLLAHRIMIFVRIALHYGKTDTFPMSHVRCICPQSAKYQMIHTLVEPWCKSRVDQSLNLVVSCCNMACMTCASLQQQATGRLWHAARNGNDWHTQPCTAIEIFRSASSAMS